MASHAELRAQYLAKHKRLVEPNQGFESLCEELWLLYSMFRKRGYTDLGTYVNKPLDHGGLPWARRKPAWAFDVGRRDPGFWSSAWGQLQAWRFVRWVVKNHRALNVEYIIFRDRIWSRKRGWQHYGPDRSHFWHIHVSGHWEGR